MLNISPPTKLATVGEVMPRVDLEINEESNLMHISVNHVLVPSNDQGDVSVLDNAKCSEPLQPHSQGVYTFGDVSQYTQLPGLEIGLSSLINRTRTRLLGLYRSTTQFSLNIRLMSVHVTE